LNVRKRIDLSVQLANCQMLVLNLMVIKYGKIDTCQQTIQEICSVNPLHAQSLQQLHHFHVDVIQGTQYMTI
jgi:hypothetical protein